MYLSKQNLQATEFRLCDKVLLPVCVCVFVVCVCVCVCVVCGVCGVRVCVCMGCVVCVVCGVCGVCGVRVCVCMGCVCVVCLCVCVCVCVCLHSFFLNFRGHLCTVSNYFKIHNRAKGAVTCVRNLKRQSDNVTSIWQLC